MLSWTDKYELLAPFQFLACRILYWMRCSHLCPRSWLAILFRNYQTNSLHGGWPRGALINWARFWGLQVPRSSINQLPWLGCRHILSLYCGAKRLVGFLYFATAWRGSLQSPWICEVLGCNLHQGTLWYCDAGAFFNGSCIQSRE